MKSSNMLGVAATAAMGMAVGAAAIYVATQDRRQLRRTVRKMSRGAEKTIEDLDHMFERYYR